MFLHIFLCQTHLLFPNKEEEEDVMMPNMTATHSSLVQCPAPLPSLLSSPLPSPPLPPLFQKVRKQA